MFKNQQMKTRLPGLWPLIVDPKAGDFTLHTDFTLSAMADSLYEYLPKEYMLLGGQRPEYQDMYEKAMKVANEKIFYYFRNPENLPLMMSGTQTHGMLIPEGQHLACFTGGMVGIGAKIFKRDDELETARALTDGCIWAYESSQSGIMPETFNLVPCESKDKCWWDRAEWHRLVLNKHAHFEGYSIDQLTSKERLPQGFTAIEDRRYQLRPEAIESVFIMYRITGDPVLQDKGWRMFKSITDHTKTPIAFAGLDDVTEEHPLQVDKMESFWTAETLKYFYLLFSEPNVISLDDYVFNTEAHPLKRPGKK